MSMYGDKELEKTKKSKDQFMKETDQRIQAELDRYKRSRVIARSEARSGGRPCDPTTTEETEEESEPASKANDRASSKA